MPIIFLPNKQAIQQMQVILLAKLLQLLLQSIISQRGQTGNLNDLFFGDTFKLFLALFYALQKLTDLAFKQIYAEYLSLLDV